MKALRTGKGDSPWALYRGLSATGPMSCRRAEHFIDTPLGPEMALNNASAILSAPALETAAGSLGNLLRPARCLEATAESTQSALTGAEAARAALGKGPNALPGAPLTAEMR